jgi:hypothetical protein
MQGIGIDLQHERRLRRVNEGDFVNGGDLAAMNV